MPSKKTCAIVLKKTKLADRDLIITFLAEDGSKGKCVARSARKPGSTFSAKLDLFRVADLFLHEGKSLYIVSEARTVEVFETCQSGFDHNAFGSAILEFAEKVSLEDLGEPKFFELTRSALRTLNQADKSFFSVLLVAYILKASAFLGMRPEFSICVLCGAKIDIASGDSFGFSISDGGLICLDCGVPYFDYIKTKWLYYLLMTRFADIVLFDLEEISIELNNALIEFCEDWLNEHFGIHLKSLDLAKQVNL